MFDSNALLLCHLNTRLTFHPNGVKVLVKFICSHQEETIKELCSLGDPRKTSQSEAVLFKGTI